MDSTPWWPEPVKAPDGSPNVIYILIDDMGYADLGCYGSRIRTPNIDALAKEGIRYNNFHVNAMCSPTRASLLSGCNHHAAGMGHICGDDMGFPGYRAAVDKKCGLISETLVENGYMTFALGKWHLVSTRECSGAGPFDNWPLGRGFNRFYGFLGACTNQFYPDLVCGNEYIQQPKMPSDGYHLSEDLADRVITYMGDLKSNDPNKPFFCYLSFGALHSPHQTPTEFIDLYKGVFDDGWDAYREEILKKQKELGIVPENTELCGDDRFSMRWDSFSEAQKRIFARYMESYAGFLTHTDAQIGRVLNYLKKIGQYENTLIVFMADNGASAEGTPYGSKNTVYHYATEQFPPCIDEDEIPKIGTEDACSHYPQCWAHASNTPFKLYKSWNHNGGIKVPLIISYPRKIKDKGAVRRQYHHVVDINATVMEVLGIKQPPEIKGVPQIPKHGISMTYTFDNPDEVSRRHVQYYEMAGNRGIWADGWKAVADHSANPEFDFSLDVWELYNTNEDFSECHDLADKYPDKLRQMIELWWHEAGKYGVLPMIESHLKNRPGFNSKAMYRYAPQPGITRRTVYPELMGGFSGRIMTGSFTITAYAGYKKGDEGVLFGSGDNMGGYALYIQDDRLKFHYNWLGYKSFSVSTNIELEECNAAAFALDFVKTREGEGICSLLINGVQSAMVFIQATPLFITNGGSFAVGKFPRISVTGDMKEKGRFYYTNTVDRVEFDYERAVDDLDRYFEFEQLLRQD
jgi:arylsulfatase